MARELTRASQGPDSEPYSPGDADAAFERLQKVSARELSPCLTEGRGQARTIRAVNFARPERFELPTLRFEA